jgi:hypothetical protein
VGLAVDTIVGVGAGSIFGHIALAQHHGAGRAHAGHVQLVLLSDLSRVCSRTVGGHEALRMCGVLDDHGEPVQRREVFARRSCAVCSARLFQRRFGSQIHHGVDVRVHLGDALQVSGGDLFCGDLTGGDSGAQFAGGHGPQFHRCFTFLLMMLLLIQLIHTTRRFDSM